MIDVPAAKSEWRLANTWSLARQRCCGWTRRSRLLRANVIAVLLIATNMLHAGPQHVLLAELESRNLDRLIEVYCRQQLNSASHQPDEQADLVIAWITAKARQACDERQLADDLAWQTIDELAAEQERVVPSEFEVARIKLQQTWLQVMRAERLVRTAALDADPEAHQDRAKRILRVAESALKDLASSMPRIARTAQPSNGWSSQDRIRDLTGRIALRRGQLLLLHAELYEPGSSDQVHLLTQALETCESLARQVGDSPLSNEARIVEIQCQLQLDNITRAEHLVRALPTLPEDSRFEHQKVILRAQLLRHQQHLDAAVNLLESSLRDDAFVGDIQSEGEARLTLIRQYLALQASSSNQDIWQQRALQQVGVLEDRFSPYFVRQAEAILTGQGIGVAGAGSVDVLARAAANFYRRQQFEEARVSFAKAAATAKDLGLFGKAYDLSFQAAAIAHQRRQHAVAANDFSTLADQFSADPRAPDAHWLSIVNTAQLARSDPANLPLYEKRLAEHVSRWPNSKSAPRAHLWLGRLKLQQNRPSDALAQLREIPLDFENYDQVVAAAREAYLMMIANAPDGDDRQRVASDCVQSLLADFERMPAAENLTPLLQSAAAGIVISASELSLLFTRAGPREATRQLDLLYLVDDTRERYEHQVNAIRGLQSALAGDADYAKKYWQFVKWKQVDLAPYYLVRLDSAANEAPNYSQRLSQLQAELASTLRQVDRWQGDSQVLLALADARGRLGERESAIKIYQQILKDAPTRIEALEGLARQQEVEDSVASAEAALASWRQMVQLSVPRSEPWYRAKVGIARCLVRTGQRQRAAEIIRVLKVVDPSLGGSPYKQQFESILAAAISDSP